MDNLGLDGHPNLLDSLYACGVFTDCHMEHIMGFNARRSKISELLDIIRRRSMLHFKLFLRCLRDTEQTYIADALEDHSGRSSISLFFS